MACIYPSLERSRRSSTGLFQHLTPGEWQRWTRNGLRRSRWFIKCGILGREFCLNYLSKIPRLGTTTCIVLLIWIADICPTGCLAIRPPFQRPRRMDPITCQALLALHHISPELLARVLSADTILTRLLARPPITLPASHPRQH